MKYIATFYSHFGAIRFKKQCETQGYEAKLMPVPRLLSSSCGTCVSFLCDEIAVESMVSEELEQIVRCVDEGYEEVFRAKDS